MKNRFFALFVACAFLLNAAGLAFADTKANKNKKSPASQLVALLPASDGVMALDVKRFMNSALPQLLSGNQTMLDEILGKVTEFKDKTGFDIRQFDYVAVGVTVKKISDTDTDFEPVILARGTYNSNALLNTAKFASNGKYREEKIGERTVYIFSPREIVEKTKPTVGNSNSQEMIDKVLAGLPAELAATSYDNNTLAFGTLNRVRETLEAKTRVDAQLADLINRKPNSVASFAANTPNGMADFVSLADDELGRNLNSIRQLYGSMDVVGENTVVSVSARTLQPAQAEGLKTSLQNLQKVFTPFLLGAKQERQKVYGRMLQNVKIARIASEVTFDLQIPQSDINVLIGAK